MNKLKVKNEEARGRRRRMAKGRRRRRGEIERKRGMAREGGREEEKR